MTQSVAIVTGSNGKTGQAILSALSEAGYQVVGLDVGLDRGIERFIVGRNRIVRSALKNREMRSLLSNNRNRLHRRRASTYYADPLPREVDSLMWPFPCVVQRSLELVDTCESWMISR